MGTHPIDAQALIAAAKLRADEGSNECSNFEPCARHIARERGLEQVVTRLAAQVNALLGQIERLQGRLSEATDIPLSKGLHYIDVVSDRLDGLAVTCGYESIPADEGRAGYACLSEVWMTKPQQIGHILSSVQEDRLISDMDEAIAAENTANAVSRYEGAKADRALEVVL